LVCLPDLPRLAATYGSSRFSGQHQSITDAAGLASARMQVHPAALPLDLVDPAFPVPSHDQQIPSGIDSAYVVASQAGRIRRLGRQHDRCHRTS
jgi:hypothetical protein